MVDFCNRVMGSLAVWSRGNRQFSGRSHAVTPVTALRLSMLSDRPLPIAKHGNKAAKYATKLAKLDSETYLVIT